LPVPNTTAPAVIVVDAMELELSLAAKTYVADVAPSAVTVNKVPVELFTWSAAVLEKVSAFPPLSVNSVSLHPVKVPAYLSYAIMY